MKTTNLPLLKSLSLLLLSLLFVGCQSSDIILSGRFSGTPAHTIYVERLGSIHAERIDSALLDEEGHYTLRIKNGEPTPEIYLMHCGAEQIPLLLQAGDRVEINAIGNVASNYTVEGSDESLLLRQFYHSYRNGLAELDQLAKRYAFAPESEQEELKQTYTALFHQIKRDQLRFIVENKSSLAALYALYQRLPGDRHLFNAESDVIYFRTVAEALAAHYPESHYIKELEEEIDRMESQQALLSNMQELDFPDLEIKDMYGQTQRLSDLKGNIILLDFWSAEAGNSNSLNAELKELYKLYHHKGLEVYQVAVDQSKALWIQTVQEQALPWISVSELQGGNSLACRLYQIEKLPSNYLFDREGNIVGRDLYGEALQQAIETLL